MFSLEQEKDGKSLNVLLKGEVQLKDVVRFNDEMRILGKLDGINQLVLNLSQVTKMDFAGLGALVSLNTSMQRYGRRLVLLAPAPHIDELMKKAEIEGFFPVCETPEEVNEFRQKR